MHHLLIPVAVAALTAAAAVIYARRRTRALNEALDHERCTARLMHGLHQRDLHAFRHRLAAASADQPGPDTAWVLAEAERIVDTALAHHRTDPREGGPQ